MESYEPGVLELISIIVIYSAITGSTRQRGTRLALQENLVKSGTG